jgi:hypothetical protein
MAHEDRVVDVRAPAAAAVLGIGGVLHLRHRHAGIVDAEVQRLATAAEVGDHRVVGIEDKLLDRCGIQRLPPTLGDRLQLAVAVELVTEEVGKQQRARADLGEDLGQPELVDLEQAGVAAAAQQRRGDPAGHVRPCAVVHECAAAAFEDARGHRGGRCLAVRGRQQRAVQRTREPLDRARLHPQQQLARQRRAAAAREPRGRARSPGCQLAGPHAGSSTFTASGTARTVHGSSPIGSPSA